MGSLVAHELALGSRLSPILLLRNSARVNAYNQTGLAISVLRKTGGEVSASRVEIPAFCRLPVGSGGHLQHIDHLVVATKAHAVTKALKPYVKHLLGTSTVVFLQNGMGVSAEVQKSLWPQKENMPMFYQAISTHGAYKLTPSTINHVGIGSLTMARLPTVSEENGSSIHLPQSPSDSQPPDLAESSQTNASPSQPPLVQALLESGLNALCVLFERFLLGQMEKLVANACINPLTAVLDCLNGDLLLAPKTIPLMKRVVRECVDCFRAEHPQLLHIPDAATYLDKDRLLSVVLDLCRATASNSSSMREDLRRLHRTEIDWINGYVVRLGYAHQVPTPTNRMLMELVQSKLTMERAKENMALRTK